MIPDSVREVIESGRLAHLATLNRDGSAQMSCIWVGIEGDEIVFGHLGTGQKVRNIRRVVTGALEIERAHKRIGSSLEAAPLVYVSDPDLFAALVDIELAEVAITSHAILVEAEGPPEAFRLDDVKGVAVEVRLAEGRKCARSWKILPSVGSDPAYPDVSARDAQALREWQALRGTAAE